MVSKSAVLLVLIFATAVSCAGDGQPADPDPNRFGRDIESFAAWDSKNAVPADPILFVGSSSIRMWKTRESFPDLPVINRGFGGSHISDVIHFLDRIVLPYAPKLIVFYAGDNDVAGGKKVARVFRDYRRFVHRVHNEFPDASIIFISIKPSGSRWSLWPEMKTANDLIEGFSGKDRRLFFADLATPLLDADGKPDDSLFRCDRLHLNDEGYKAWSKALRAVIEKVRNAYPAHKSGR